jgi:hypothetical protein
LPSAKLTVEEFREIWFQNSSDPPAFVQPRPATAESEEGMSDVEQADGMVSEMNKDSRDSLQADHTVTDAEAQSAFLEDLVTDRALEEEINSHLGNQEFRQALAQVNGIPALIWF